MSESHDYHVKDFVHGDPRLTAPVLDLSKLGCHICHLYLIKSTVYGCKLYHTLKMFVFKGSPMTAADYHVKDFVHGDPRLTAPVLDLSNLGCHIYHWNQLQPTGYQKKLYYSIVSRKNNQTTCFSKEVKGLSISYVVSKSKIFDPLAVFFIKVYVVSHL